LIARIVAIPALGAGVSMSISATEKNWRCGNRASSAIFWVGATRAPDAASRAPQPPQNRESGALSVAQLGQRIP